MDTRLVFARWVVGGWSRLDLPALHIPDPLSSTRAATSSIKHNPVIQSESAVVLVAVAPPAAQATSPCTLPDPARPSVTAHHTNSRKANKPNKITQHSGIELTFHIG